MIFQKAGTMPTKKKVKSLLELSINAISDLVLMSLMFLVCYIQLGLGIEFFKRAHARLFLSSVPYAFIIWSFFLRHFF